MTNINLIKKMIILAECMDCPIAREETVSSLRGQLKAQLVANSK